MFDEISAFIPKDVRVLKKHLCISVFVNGEVKLKLNVSSIEHTQS